MSANIPNNKWMKKLSPKERIVDTDKAMAQFYQMYSLFSQEVLVYLLPPKDGLQDQVYITNAGVVLPHLDKTIILSNFKAKGRPGEEKELKEFVSKMGYKTMACPFNFEGEAELKWVKDNIYIGGYGGAEKRTNILSLVWIEKNFDTKIIKVEETDPLTYHLDCSVFPINSSKIICNSDLIKGDILKQIEKIAEVIPITKKEAQYGLTNSLRIGSIIYNASDIKDLKLDDEDYEFQKQKNEKLEKICRDVGLELIFINLSEFNKSGAALSCCILHLTYCKFLDGK